MYALSQVLTNAHILLRLGAQISIRQCIASGNVLRFGLLLFEF